MAVPLRKLYYNLTITMMSIAVALFIGVVAICTLAVRLLGLNGRFAFEADLPNVNLNYLAIAIMAVFALSWGASVVTFKIMSREPRLVAADAGQRRLMPASKRHAGSETERRPQPQNERIAWQVARCTWFGDQVAGGVHDILYVGLNVEPVADL